MPPLVSFGILLGLAEIGKREQKFLWRMYDNIKQPKILVSKACKTISIKIT